MKHPKKILKLHWNFSKTPLKIPWITLDTLLKHPWNYPETHFKHQHKGTGGTRSVGKKERKKIMSEIVATRAANIGGTCNLDPGDHIYARAITKTFCKTKFSLEGPMHRRSHLCPGNHIDACTFNLPGQAQGKMWSSGRQYDCPGINVIAGEFGLAESFCGFGKLTKLNCKMFLNLQKSVVFHLK